MTTLTGAQAFALRMAFDKFEINLNVNYTYLDKEIKNELDKICYDLKNNKKNRIVWKIEYK